MQARREASSLCGSFSVPPGRAPGCGGRRPGAFARCLVLRVPLVPSSIVPTSTPVASRPRHHQPIRPTVASFFVSAAAASLPSLPEVPESARALFTPSPPRPATLPVLPVLDLLPPSILPRPSQRHRAEDPGPGFSIFQQVLLPFPWCRIGPIDFSCFGTAPGLDSSSSGPIGLVSGPAQSRSPNQTPNFPACLPGGRILPSTRLQPAATASSDDTMASVVRSTALRAGGACVRCRKGKTKCVYENGRAPCKNCAKGLHDCYLPSESMSHGGHGVSPARVQQRARESLPSERTVSSTSGDRQAPPASSVSRHASTTTEKYVSLFFLVIVSLSLSHTHTILRVAPFPFSFSSSFFSEGGPRLPLPLIFLCLPGAPVGSAFFPTRSRLPPPAERASSSAGSRRRQACPNFLRPAFISQTGTDNFPLLRALLPVSPPMCLGLGAQTNGALRSEAPCPLLSHHTAPIFVFLFIFFFFRSGLAIPWQMPG